MLKGGIVRVSEKVVKVKDMGTRVMQSDSGKKLPQINEVKMAEKLFRDASISGHQAHVTLPAEYVPAGKSRQMSFDLRRKKDEYKNWINSISSSLRAARA